MACTRAPVIMKRIAQLSRVFATILCTLLVAGCVGRTRGSELYPDVARESNKEIKNVRFVGGDPFGEDTLSTIIDTQPTHCSLLGIPICLPLIGGTKVQRLSVEVVRRDVARLAAFYRREGYFATRVLPRAEPADPKEGDAAKEVDVTFIIQRGDPIQLESFTIEGTEGVVPPDSLLPRLPLKAGEIFNVAKYEASADQVLRELQARGYAYAEILRNYTVDTLTDRATATLTAIPRVQVHVDSIVVQGADHLGHSMALRQLTFKRGDVLQLPKLVESQRNLYSLEIVQLASVAIAPDSMQATPGDSSRATVLVSIAEAPANQAEAALGYGDVDCFRADASWLNRSFGGGARRLNLQASVSKVGLAGVTDFGLEKWLCTAFQQDTFQNSLDYRVSGDYTLPYFLSPRNQVNFGLYSERVSEPDVYQRQAHGAQLGVSHRIKTGRIVNLAVEVSRAKTIASPVLFCSAFQICIPEQIDRLTLPRYRNTLTLSYLDDHTDNPLDPTRGHVMRSNVTYATPWLSSSVVFTRWTGDAAVYRRLKGGRIFAASVRLGNFFQSASLDPTVSGSNFLPPEERFFAGGANTVRGYARNELGGGVYVQGEDTTATPQFVPTGGTSMGIVNVEMRFPLPLLRRQLYLATFVDAGAIATGHLWSMDGGDWRFTPGVGARAATPVGPIRIDVAYNPYPPVSGPLFHAVSGRLVPIRADFTPPSPDFFGRIRLQVGIGQAF